MAETIMKILVFEGLARTLTAGAEIFSQRYLQQGK